MQANYLDVRHLASNAWTLFLLSVGAFLAAFSIQTFLIPNRLIDGGIVGLAMIFGNLFGLGLIPYFYVFLTLPFVFFAYRAIGRSFVIHMGIASILFFGFMVLLHHLVEADSTIFRKFEGETLEVVVIGGSLLGIGLGLIIRVGGCVDGTEVLGIVINKRTGFTVGQTVLACNVLVFGALGLVFQDWHPPFLSLIMYMVVAKVMDAVVVGLDETKSVLIISSKYREISKAILHELGLGLTVMYGRGGFSGSEKEILYVITERLQLATLKDLVLREDPSAFIAVENLHEVANGNPSKNKMNPVAQVKTLLTSVFLKKV